MLDGDKCYEQNQSKDRDEEFQKQGYNYKEGFREGLAEKVRLE